MQLNARYWLVLVTVGLMGCSESPDSSPPATRPAPRAVAPKDPAPKSKPAPAVAPPRKTIEVSSAEEFVAAVGSNRVLRLRAGKYRLSDVKQRYLKHLYWREVHDGYELVVRNVRNLRIEAAEKGKVELLAEPAYAYVLAFEKSAGVELSGLVLGHSPSPGGCTGGVVQLSGCRDAVIRDCVLFGCGMEGLSLKHVEGMIFDRSVIRDCTYGILTMSDCSRIVFRDSQFMNNRKYHGFEIKQSLGVKFERCRITNNVVSGSGSGALFKVASSSEVEMIRGLIQGNRYGSLVLPSAAMKFEGVEIRDNRPPDAD